MLQMAIYILSIAAIVGLDQLTKFLIVKNLAVLGTIAPFIPGVVQLRYTHNYGASFSILQGKQVFLITFTGVAMLVLMFLLFRGKFKSNAEKIAFIFIIGGGIGNLIDRVINGYVVDFIDLQFMNFAVFNVADCFVCVGVLLYIIYFVYNEIVNAKKPKNNTHEANKSDISENTAPKENNTAE